MLILLIFYHKKKIVRKKFKEIVHILLLWESNLKNLFMYYILCAALKLIRDSQLQDSLEGYLFLLG